MKKGIKGITLISLVITIIVLLILASVGTYSGINVIKSSQLTKFTTEMKIMQVKVNEIYENYKNNGTVGGKKGEDILTKLGEEIPESGEIKNQANKAIGEGIDKQEGYTYFNQDTIKSLQIEGVEREFFVNVKKRSVISYNGFEYNGTIYYKLEELPNGLYNVEHKEISGEPTFNCSQTKISEGKWKISVTNIEYSENIGKWDINYRLKNSEKWDVSEDTEFTINQQGVYEIKIKNNKVESNIKEIVIAQNYIKDGLLLHYDAINNTGEGDEMHSKTATVWKDLSGNNNDGILQNFDNTQESGWATKTKLVAKTGKTTEIESLKFDGNNDTVDTRIPAATTFPSNHSYTLEITFNMNNVTAAGSQYEQVDTSVIFGGQSWTGYGIYWNTFNLNNQNYTLYCGHRNTALVSRVGFSINNITQKNIVTQVYDVENEKIKMYLNGEFIGEDKIVSTANYGEREEIMGNIKIDKNDVLLGNPRGVYSDMNVYSARIYDRALAEEEVRINQKIDENRF